MGTEPNGWQTPKTNWTTADPVGNGDLNRIEGNINAVELGNRTIDDAQVPSSDTGYLRQLLDWLANRLKVISGKTNWYDSPTVDLETHTQATGNPHSAVLDDIPDSVYQKVHGDYVDPAGKIDKIKQGTQFDNVETRYYSVSLVVMPSTSGHWGIGTKWHFEDGVPNSYLPLNLPHGAVVTSVQVWASSYTGHISLHRSLLSSDSEVTMAQVNNGSGTDSSIDYATIDNANYTYYVHGYASAGTCECYGIKITYTISKPLP
jgi:hypothetical protein